MRSDSSTTTRSDLLNASIGATIAIAILAGGMLLVGQVSGGEARRLLEAMLPTTRFLCSAVMGVSATVLALMLTMLSLGAAADARLKTEYYRRIRQIALIATVTFIWATALLCFHSIPFSESSDAPSTAYQWLYYLLLGSAAALGGTLIAAALMLYFAVREVVKLHTPGADSALVADDEQPG